MVLHILDTHRHGGCSDQDEQDERRGHFKERVNELLELVMDHLPLDSAIDQLAADFMLSRLPPVPPAAAAAPAGPSAIPPAADSVLPPTPPLRLAGDNIARLVVEGDCAVVYHCMRNPRDLHMETTTAAAAAARTAQGREDMPEGRLDFPLEAAAVLEDVVHHPQQSARVIDPAALPPSAVDSVNVLNVLWRAGVLVLA